VRSFLTSESHQGKIPHGGTDISACPSYVTWLQVAQKIKKHHNSVLRCNKYIINKYAKAKSNVFLNNYDCKLSFAAHIC
jgi:hypothetical protein